MLQMNFWIDTPTLILMTSRTTMRWILLLGERLKSRWLGEIDAKVAVVGGEVVRPLGVACQSSCKVKKKMTIWMEAWE